MFEQFLNKASELLANGRSFAIAEVVRHSKPISGKSGDKAIISADGSIWGWIGGGCAQPVVVKEALKALQDGRPRLVRINATDSQEEGVVAYNMTCHSGGTLEVFIEPVLPKPHLLIFGRSPVARTLAKLATAINYTVSVYAAGADRDTFPDVDQISADLSSVKLKISPNMFAVVCTQGEDDEEALEAALSTKASYVAFVASRAKAEKTRESLRQRDIAPARLDQLRAPAGLDIQARSQEEIAVSILAEIIQICRTFGTNANSFSIHATVRQRAKDPICGMDVDLLRATHKSEFEGRPFYFCCSDCKRVFDAEPKRFALAYTSP